MTRGALPRGGVEKLLVADVILDDGIRLLLENGKTLSLDYQHDGGRGRNIFKEDEISIDYHPKPAKGDMRLVSVTVRREDKEIFRDRIPIGRIIAPLDATTV
ncbi:MAG: hypothetical protein A3J76_00425 [Candidatus Moranbacteria bacterium RBG_13_45_13]|nr:MAG: hypothetical protein A3J76_00425 [Candidatus Moranbacteria bacterium RBG_13_45_13]